MSKDGWYEIFVKETKAGEWQLFAKVKTLAAVNLLVPFLSGIYRAGVKAE